MCVFFNYVKKKKFGETKIFTCNSEVVFPQQQHSSLMIKERFIFFSQIILHLVWNKLRCISALKVFEDEEGFLHLSGLIFAAYVIIRKLH